MLDRTTLTIAFLMLAGSALGAPPKVAPGAYVIARTSEWPDVCHLKLEAGETLGGRAVKPAANCSKAAPWMGGIAAWRQDGEGDVVLGGVTRKTLIRFRRSGDDALIGRGPDGIDYELAPQ